MPSERTLLEAISKQLPKHKAVLGFGDDAAIFKLKKKQNVVWCVDTIVEGQDFVFKKTPAAQVGWKALAINVSDLAAMGAEPKSFLISLNVPAKIKQAWLKSFYRGLLKCAREYGMDCLGGDLSASKEFSATVTVVGVCRSRWAERSRVAKGDWIGVTGDLGGSISGKHLKFKPRVAEGSYLVKQGVRTMLDISDGFLMDLENLLGKSKLGAKIDLNCIPVSRAAKVRARGNKRRALTSALSDGEDFELLFTAKSKVKKSLEKTWKRKFPKVALHWVGRVQSGKKISWLQQDKPVRFNISKKGYSHF